MPAKQPSAPKLRHCYICKRTSAQTTLYASTPRCHECHARIVRRAYHRRKAAEVAERNVGREAAGMPALPAHVMPDDLA